MSNDLILDPNDPDLDGPEDKNVSCWRKGAKKLLNRTSGLLQRLSQLLLKVVKTIFPWNRRAKRRLEENSSEDEDA